MLPFFVKAFLGKKEEKIAEKRNTMFVAAGSLEKNDWQQREEWTSAFFEVGVAFFSGDCNNHNSSLLNSFMLRSSVV